ncbi:MAG TPA: hypothetical protein DEQ61_23580 [Streptomyces sp.]|nr:hypothetical protein [Streptomyces sp.]
MSRLIDTIAAERATGVKQGTIRQWLRRGKLTAHGHDYYGRALVDLDEFDQVTDRRHTACKSERASSH